MCGIAGIWDQRRTSSKKEIDEQTRLMCRALSRRGPDSEGLWVSEEDGLAIGHRRLAIFDLSKKAGQPMHSPSGRYLITFNGAIFNHPEIRQQIKTKSPSVRFISQSDTETILHSIEVFGFEKTLALLNGMFAMAIWDCKNRELLIARDRFGEKPLYFGFIDGRFVFASQLSAFRSLPFFQPDICETALIEYLTYGYISAPSSIFKFVKKLPAGCFAKVDKDVTIEKYWEVDDLFSTNGNHSACLSDIEHLDQLEKELEQAVLLRMRGDVPFGAFLSGGIDSSLVTAFMQKHSTTPIETFSIGFEEKFLDEAPMAREVARYLGARHHEIYVTPSECRDLATELSEIFDEPFADPSAIPTRLVAGKARNNVTVALTGDGGDELFKGYNRHIWGPRAFKCQGWIPKALRNNFASTIEILGSDDLEIFWSKLFEFLPKKHKHLAIGHKIKKFSLMLRSSSYPEAYKYLTNIIDVSGSDILKNRQPFKETQSVISTPFKNEFEDYFQYADMVKYLPDNILVKADRATMDVALESRTPFLDPNLAFKASQLPNHLKANGGKGKVALRTILKRHIPSDLVDRPKAGFTPPIGNWLRGELNDWATDLINSKHLLHDSRLSKTKVNDLWRDFKLKRGVNQQQMWTILTYLAWERRLNS